jgi:hypothetical protein
MDGVREFLDDVQKRGFAKGHFLGLLNILIGRRIARTDGTVISTGATWRDVAAELKRSRFDPEAVRELGIDPGSLAPRDRQRYWYSAISQAQVGSDAAFSAGNKLAHQLAKAGYVIGPAPGAAKK